MRAADLQAAGRVGDTVHPDHPEEAAVLADRLRLYPPGCLVLEGAAGIEGYTVAHPGLFGYPPQLNTELGELPAGADTFHLHDLAILPEARRSGAGTQAVALLAAVARADGFTRLSLVAVGQSAGFWRRRGFAPVDPAPAALATYSGATYLARPLR